MAKIASIGKNEFIIPNYSGVRPMFKYGGIFVEDGVPTQTIPTGNTYTKLVNFTTNLTSFKCNSDYANSQITIGETGIYFIAVALSCSSSGTNNDYDFAIFLNGVEQMQVHASRKFATNDIGAVALMGIVQVTQPLSVIDLRAKHSYGFDLTYTIHDCSISVFSISP